MSVSRTFLSRILWRCQSCLVRFSLRAANSLTTYIRQSLCVLCLWVLSIVRLLNLVCVIVERSHVFSLRAEEKDLSPAALVAGFTRRSLHRVMISVIIHFSASESCLILAKMSSKQVNSRSFINTLKISSWTFNVLTSTAKKVGAGGGGSPTPCAVPGSPRCLLSLLREFASRKDDSLGFWNPRCGTPNSRYWLIGIQGIPDSNRERDYGFCELTFKIPMQRIPVSTSKYFPESGLP